MCVLALSHILVRFFLASYRKDFCFGYNVVVVVTMRHKLALILGRGDGWGEGGGSESAEELNIYVLVILAKCCSLGATCWQRVNQKNMGHIYSKRKKRK